MSLKFPRVPFLTFLAGPSLSYGLGVTLNKICMAFNGGQMPVLLPDCSNRVDMAGDPHHICMVASTHLKILADWLIFPWGETSIGDMLIDLGGNTFWYGLAIWATIMILKYNDMRRKLER